MKHGKCFAFILLSMLLLTYFTPLVVSQSNETKSVSDQRLIDKIRMVIYSITKNVKGVFPWAGYRLTEPKQFIAEPNEIDLEYFKQINITIGMINTSSNDWELIENNPPRPLFPSEFYKFDLELPADLPKDYFIYNFQPSSISNDEKGPLKTSLQITSNIPKDARLPNTLILRVNISTYVTGGFLYLPPTPSKNPNTNWIIWMATAPFWFLSSISPANPFGKIYSGKTIWDEPSTYVEIMVKVKRLHQAGIESPKTTNIGTDEIVSLPLSIQNFGSHVDTFNFRVSLNNQSNLIVSSPSAITLAPNELGITHLSVAAQYQIDDPGTLHTITVEAYSIFDPNQEIFSNTITVYTKGVHVTEIGIIYFSGFAVVIILIIIFIFYRQRLKFVSICKKPEKPWIIPKEKEHLDKLKEKDKEKYNETLEMMRDEYKSSLLWYNSYCNYLLKENNKRKQKTEEKVIPKKSKEKIQNEEIKPELAKKEEIVETELVKEEPAIKPKVDRKAEEERRKKEKALAKIRKQQEKQRR